MSSSDITKRISDALSEVMISRGIVKHKQAEYIRKTMNMSAVQSHRKVNGSVPWDIKQLEKILFSLDSTLSDFFNFVEKNGYEKIKTSVKINSIESHAYLYIDKNASYETTLSAVNINNEWKIIATDEAKKNITLHGSYASIISIHLEPLSGGNKKPNIIILDDDKDIVNVLLESLSKYDITIDGYTQLEELDKRINSNPADVYILDWLIKDKSVYNSIKKIRESKKQDALIIILTGQDSNIVDDEIFAAIKNFDIPNPLEKPVRMQLLKHYIDRYMESK